MSTDPVPGLLTEGNLWSHFHDSVTTALANQSVEADPATTVYLVNLLTEYARAERLFSYTQEGTTMLPLAELYRLAWGATSSRERNLFLRRIGDVALFVSGLFGGWLRRRTVDVDYYVAMGGGAYAYLSEAHGGERHGQALASVFRELSEQFVPFMDVLAEIGEKAPGAREPDPLRLHELWSKTGSRRAARALQALGMLPVRSLLAH